MHPRTTFNDWIYFPIKYNELTIESKIIFNILDIDSNIIGITMINLFNNNNNNNTLLNGVYELFVDTSVKKL